MRYYSIIIPVYNRPEEIDELLDSLRKQNEAPNFEVLIIEDGSTKTCKHIINKYTKNLNLKYHFKQNTGQGFSRNYGFENAKGDYFIVFDSDCIIPPNYLKNIDNYINLHKVDAFGGPDKAHYSFSLLQKSINYSMTGIFTTGGIRGNKQRLGIFHPRSFNMGISKEVYNKVGGYKITRMAEDLEYSIRIIKAGFNVKLINEGYVYHKRRTSLLQFFKQLYFFGRARINLGRFFPNEVKIIHWFPLSFTFGFLSILPLMWSNNQLGLIMGIMYLFYFSIIFLDASQKNKSVTIGFISILTSFVQLIAYGIGFFREKFLAKFLS